MIFEEGNAADANRDESKVPPYMLPDPLIDSSGSAVKTVEQWQSKRRGELFALFSEQVYGHPLPPPKRSRFLASQNNDASGARLFENQSPSISPGKSTAATWT